MANKHMKRCLNSSVTDMQVSRDNTILHSPYWQTFKRLTTSSVGEDVSR